MDTSTSRSSADTTTPTTSTRSICGRKLAVRSTFPECEKGKWAACKTVPRLSRDALLNECIRSFHSVFVPCPEDEGYPSENRSNFTTPTWRVRDTLEQIDTARFLIDKYNDQFELTLTARDWRKAMRRGKFGGMLGVEGGHQLGSSLSTIRTYFDLGVRYITLTHTCHSALADSCGYVERPSAHDLVAGTPLAPRWNGLSSFGRTAVREMNRLGMMVDLSHTSPKTASDALSHSLAPVIFSHSNARGVHSHSRNIPDSILRRIGSIDSRRKGTFNLSEDGEKGQGWGADTGEVDKPVPSGDVLIMLNFSPTFVSEWSDGSGPRANVSLMADHAEYIGRLAGREHVGIGSDFDGIEDVPEGLEDVSKYPNLIAELLRRGWSDAEVMGLTSGELWLFFPKLGLWSITYAQSSTSCRQSPADRGESRSGGSPTWA